MEWNLKHQQLSDHVESISTHWVGVGVHYTDPHHLVTGCELVMRWDLVTLCKAVLCELVTSSYGCKGLLN